MGYYLVRHMPKHGEVFPGNIGNYHPALIARCEENPVGIKRWRFDGIVIDPFEKALVLTTGIIIEYVEAARGLYDKKIYSPEAMRDGYIRKAWRDKIGKRFYIQRGHRLKVKE